MTPARMPMAAAKNDNSTSRNWTGSALLVKLSGWLTRDYLFAGGLLRGKDVEAPASVLDAPVRASTDSISVVRDSTSAGAACESWSRWCTARSDRKSTRLNSSHI